MKKIRVALLGLGKVGESFAEHFLEQIQERAAPIEIVAVADHHTDSAVALGFSQNGVPVFKDAMEVAKLGDKVDIMFDLTGNSRTRQELRLKLLETRNTHTIIATEGIVDLLWCFFDEPVQFKAAVGY
jgi:homoserine dehydrogenase